MGLSFNLNFQSGFRLHSEVVLQIMMRSSQRFTRASSKDSRCAGCCLIKFCSLSSMPYYNKDTILLDMDSLDYEDKHYQRSKTDLENHLYKTYDKIDEAEELLVSAKAKKRSLLADKITGDNIYKALIFFDELYAQMNEAEKREFLSQLVDNVQIYEERKENGQWLKSIEFKLPIIEKEFTLSLDNDTQNETVVSSH